MRRLLAVCLLLMCGWMISPLAAAEEPVLEARAYLLMDGTTGQVLIAHNGESRLPVASTTKIMTAILAIEHGRLDELVTAGQKPYDTGGSTIYLDIGEQQTLMNLLYALMLESANDAGVAIAEHLAVTEERFAALMNEKARALGATRTHFVNAHGLHHPEHLSTAYDQALIARYALQNPVFRELVLVEEIAIPGAKGQPPRKLINRNRLVGYYPGITGVKNGYTEEAELTLVASAKRGDTELIAVVLGAKSRLYTMTMALLDAGFERYETRWVARQGEVVPLSPLGPLGVAHDLALTLERGAGPLHLGVEMAADVKPPIGAGQVVGWRTFSLGGREVGRVALVAQQAADLPLGPGAGRQGPGSAGSGEGPTVAQGLLLLLAWLGGSLWLTVGLNRLRSQGGVYDEAA